MKNQPFLQKIIIPSDLNGIEPRATQVWNCDEIRFYRNGRWNKVIGTYKFSRRRNADGKNWRVSTILVHVNCIYLS